MTASLQKQVYKNWADNIRKIALDDIFASSETTEDVARHKAAKFISTLNIQKYIRDDYRGRVLLELFQNADDAANLSLDKNKTKIKIISDGRILKILNQGIVFNEDSLGRIIDPARSTKKDDDKTTGSKGIGFRSVLNWSDDVKIYSGDFAVHFSKEKSINEIQTQYNKTRVYDFIIKEDKDWDDKLIFLSFPFATEFPKEWVPGKGYLDNDTYYDTCIEIKLNDLNEYLTARNDFLKDHILSMLFFLKIGHIYFETIDINTNEKEKTHIEITKTSTKNINDLNYCVATLSQYEQDMKVKEENFHIFNQDTESIAIPFDFDKNRTYEMYATFPIQDQSCPFPVIMNGRNFQITSNRNSFIEDEQINFESAQKLQDMLITKIAPYFAKSKFGKQALEMVAYSKIISATIFQHNTQDIDTTICNQDIIPTTNGEYHKISDIFGEITYDNIPDFLITGPDCRFISSDTHDLLKFSDNLYQKIKTIKPFELCSIIDSKSMNWSSEQRMSTLLFWLDSVWSDYVSETHILPRLIKTQKNGFYTYSKKEFPYFYSGTDVIAVPEWLDLMIIDSDDQEELFRQFKIKHPAEVDKPSPTTGKKETIDRVITHKYDHYINIKQPFGYMDKTGLRTQINSQINGDFNRAIDSVKFVYANYKNDSEQTTDSNSDHPTDSTVSWYVPCANGDVLPATKAYFGIEYTNNELKSKICESAGLIPIASASCFSVAENEMGEFIETIKSCLNVRDNILFKKTKISDPCYKMEAATQIQKQNPSFENIYVFEQEGLTIPELNDILENAAQTDILEWLTKYICPRLSQTESISCKYSRYRKSETPVALQMQNYIIYKLRNTAWIKINGFTDPIAPKYCLIQKKNSAYTFPSDLVPVIPEYDTYKTLWDLLKSNQYIHQLPADAFYNLLLKLPEIDTSGKLSKYIYSQIAKTSDQQEFLDILIHSECKEKRLFFQQGKLWAKTKYDNAKFYPVSDGIYYTSRNVLNIENKPIIETPLRQGTFENFQQIFNVRKFEENVIASYDRSVKHSANDEFQEKFEDFKKYLYALNETTNLTNALPNLEISLVQEIHLVNTDETIKFNDYDIIPTDKRNKYFIKLQKDQQPIYKKLGTNIGEICNQISSSKDIFSSIKLLFIAYMDKDMDEIKEILFNNGGDIDFLTEYKNIKQQFFSAIETIDNSIDIEQLLNETPVDFENFDSSKNTESIIQILKNLNLDVKDFEKAGFNYINLKNYNKQKLQTFVFDNEEKYKLALYNDLLTKPDEQHSFYNKIQEFNHLNESIEIPNSREFNPENFIKIPEQTDNNVDIEEIYNNNLIKLKQECSDEDIIEEMLNNSDIRSNIVFGNLEPLKQIYQDKSDKKITESETKEESGNEEMLVMEINNLNINDNVVTITKKETKKSIPTKTRFDKASTESKQNAGSSAEYEAYKSFKKKYGEDSIKWVSSNAEKHKVIPQGYGNDSLGYDMRYTDENGTVKYVEVKNATTESNSSYSFLISANEISCWEHNKDNYLVALVDKKSYSIQILSGDDLEKCIKSAKPETQKCIVPFNIKNEDDD